MEIFIENMFMTALKIFPNGIRFFILTGWPSGPFFIFFPTDWQPCSCDRICIWLISLCAFGKRICLRRSNSLCLNSIPLKGCEFQNRQIMRLMFLQLCKQITRNKRIKNGSEGNYAKIIKHRKHSVGPRNRSNELNKVNYFHITISHHLPAVPRFKSFWFMWQLYHDMR